MACRAQWAAQTETRLSARGEIPITVSVAAAGSFDLSQRRRHQFFGKKVKEERYEWWEGHSRTNRPTLNTLIFQKI